MKKQRRIRPRFGLRSILVLTTLVAVICGGWLRQAQMQRYACERLNEYGIVIALDPPRWWLDWLPKPILSFGGGHYFSAVTDVDLHISIHPPKRLLETPHRNDLLSLVVKFPNVTSLRISNDLVDPTDFPLLAHCRKLELLQFQSHEITDVDLELLPRLPSLTTLRFDGGSTLSGRFINTKRFPNLRQLYCSYTHLNDDAMQEIGRFTELRELELSFTNVTDKGMAAISSLNKLESISLIGTRVTGIGVGNLSALERVALAQSDLDDAGLSEIAQLAKMKDLDLSDCVFVTDAGIRSLANHPSLSTLSASRCGLTDACSDALTTIKSLEVLNLDDTGIRSIAAFAAYPKLSILEISSTKVPIEDVLRFSEHPACKIYIKDPYGEFESGANYAGFSCFSGLGNDRQVLTSEEICCMAAESLGGNSASVYLAGIDGLKVKHFENFGCDITHLNFARSQVDGDVFKFIRDWPLLSELDARRSSVSNDDLDAIGKLRTLVKLKLDGTSIDDVGIFKIESLTDLEELSLGKTNLTPVCLKTITKLPKLTSLTLPFVPDAGSLIQLLEACRSLTEVNVVPESAMGDFCSLEDCQINVLKVSEVQLGNIDIAPMQLRRLLERIPCDLSDPFGDGLTVGGQKLSDEHCAVLAGFAGIVKLDLSGSDVTDVGIGHLSKLSNLQSLNFANTNVTAVGLRLLQANRKLSTLTCAAKSWTVDFVDALFELKCLAELSLPFRELPREAAIAFATQSNANDLEWYEGGPDWESRFYCSGTDWMAGIAPFDPESPGLMLVGSLIDDAKLDEVVSSPVIQHVYVKSVDCSTEALMAKLLTLTSTTNLSFSSVALTPNDIGSLHKLHQLESLELENCKLTNAHIAQFATLQRLSTLMLACDELEPEGITELTKLSRLRKLILTTTCSTEKYAELQRQLGKRCQIVRSTR